MSRFTPKQAVRTGQRARVAIAGPSGSGKTWDALLLAEVFGGKALVLDTERGSSALYSDRFSFDVIEWTPPFDPRELADEIHARAGDYDVLVIDSLSHFWEGEGGTRDIVDAAAARSKGNSFAGWKEGTPAQDAMVQAILSAPCHVIGTMRSKTDYVLEERNGKQVPRKVGMAPIQRAGMEYEFTVTCEVDRDHILVVDKSRCVELSDAVFPPSKVTDMGDTLMRWLAENEPEPAACAKCGEQVPGGLQRDVMRSHMVDVHEWVRTEDGKVAPPQDPSGETRPPVSPDVPSPIPSHGDSDAAGAESQHSTAASAPAATIDSKWLKRIQGRLDGLPDEIRRASEDRLVELCDGRFPNGLIPGDVPTVNEVVDDGEKAEKVPA